MKKIIIINGPNLNLLEKRDSAIYGVDSLKDIEQYCHEAAQNKANIDFFQSNLNKLVRTMQPVGDDRRGFGGYLDLL